MTNLEQQHFNAIQPILLKGLRFTQDAAKASEAITIEQMKGFAEWVGSHGYWLEDMTMLWFEDEHEADGCYSTEELLTEYLKTLS